PMGRALVRETGAAVLAERPRVSPGAEHGTGAAAAGRAPGGGVPGFLLVDVAPRIRLPRRVAGQLDSGQQRHVGGVQPEWGHRPPAGRHLLGGDASRPTVGGAPRHQAIAGGGGDVRSRDAGQRAGAAGAGGTAADGASRARLAALARGAAVFSGGAPVVRTVLLAQRVDVYPRVLRGPPLFARHLRRTDAWTAGMVLPAGSGGGAAALDAIAGADGQAIGLSGPAAGISGRLGAVGAGALCALDQ